jgi:hypothetical protein
MKNGGVGFDIGHHLSTSSLGTEQRENPCELLARAGKKREKKKDKNRVSVG